MRRAYSTSVARDIPTPRTISPILRLRHRSRSVSHSASPSRTNETAVFGFIEGHDGTTLRSTTTSRNQPARTVSPTTIAAMPIGGLNLYVGTARCAFTEPTASGVPPRIGSRTGLSMLRSNVDSTRSPIPPRSSAALSRELRETPEVSSDVVPASVGSLRWERGVREVVRCAEVTVPYRDLAGAPYRLHERTVEDE